MQFLCYYPVVMYYQHVMLLIATLQCHWPAPGVSVWIVSRLLKGEWLRWRSVVLIQIVIVAVKEYGFDVNAVENGETVMDKICASHEPDVVLPILASLVEAGARPQLKYDDIIIQCIQLCLFGKRRQENACGYLVDYITFLLKHGAKLNDVQRTQRGVKLESHGLRYLLKTPGIPHDWGRDYVRLTVMLLVHGACVDPKHVMTSLLESKYAASSFKENPRGHRVQMSPDDCNRLMRYFRSTGFKGYSSLFNRYKNSQRKKKHLSDINLQKMKKIQRIRKYLRKLEPRPESLQFQCRRVIRQQMSIAADGKSILDGIDDLPLPPILRDYMKLKDAE